MTNSQRNPLQMVFADPNQPIRLDQFRDILIRQEETIIFALIERAQFVLNPAVYDKSSNCLPTGALKGRYQHFDGCFLDFLFQETEKLHALVRRYTSPDEQPFYPDCLPQPLLPELNYSAVIQPNAININPHIKTCYLNKILPQICRPGDDPTGYGSTATCDIAVLQSLSKRIHFGKFIAEAKFQAEREKYTKLIENNDADGIMNALTNTVVEKKVLQRVTLKASTYGQDIDASGVHASGNCKVDPQVISDVYRDFVMPLTKQVQVAYLLQRLEHPTICFVGPKGSTSYSAAKAHYGKANDNNFVCGDSISDVFSNVMANKAALGVVPLEDSTKGMIKHTQELLISSLVNVVSEIVVEQKFIVAAQSESQADMTHLVTTASSEAIAMKFAEQQNIVPLITLVDTVEDAAAAAVADRCTAAVTTMDAAEAFNLSVLPFDFGSIETHDVMRFIVISKGSSPTPSGRDKTLLYLSVKHETGGLLDALVVLKKHRVNMTCLESISCPDPWKYNFFIEIDGHAKDQSVDGAVMELLKSCVSLRCLGSFPVNHR